MWKNNFDRLISKLIYMKKLLITIFSLFALGAWAQVTATSVQVTDSGGFFPQLNRQGTQLLFSPTHAKELILFDFATRQSRVVSSKGVPGFSAIFGQNGKVYYVTMERRKNNLIYRTGHEFDPVTGKDKVVLKPQHGAVHVVMGSKGVAIVGEKKSWNVKKAGVFAWTQGPKLYIVENGKTRTLTPVQGSVGYLWASISPDGTKVVFEAAAKGLYVCDLNGRILAQLGKYLMPCWLNDDYLVAMTSSGSKHISGSHIFLVKADGTQVETLTPEDGAIQPSVAAGKVVYTTREGAVHLMEF